MDGRNRSLQEKIKYQEMRRRKALEVQVSIFPEGKTPYAVESEGSAYHPWVLGQEMYSDLAPGQVRLLRFSSSGTDAGTPYLEFTLTSHYLHDVPPYTAVSYTWKEEDFYWYDAMDSKLLEIRLNGVCFSAASKLAFMIKTLVKKKALRRSYLWIDAICINQTDKKELGHQVGLMGDIYSRASNVVIFFGTPSRYTDAAMDLLSLPDMLSSGIGNDASVGIIELMEHPYWFRGWIIQEVARCDTVALFCGNKIINWHLLMSLFEHYQFKPLLRHQRPGSMLPAHQIQAIDSFRQEHCNHLVQVLQSTRAALTTDPRDSVYAKLGLALDSQNLIAEPDYSLGVEDVFKRLAAAHISRYGCLYLICLTEDSSYNLPSWVPDWSKTSGRLALQPSLVGHLNRNRASGGSAGFSADLSVLFVRGIQFDTIAPFDKGFAATLSVDTCKVCFQSLIPGICDCSMRSTYASYSPQPSTMLSTVCRTVLANKTTIAGMEDRGFTMEQLIRVFTLRCRLLKHQPSATSPYQAGSNSSRGNTGLDFNNWWLTCRDMVIAGTTLRSWADGYAVWALPRHDSFTQKDRIVSDDLRMLIASMMWKRQLMGTASGRPVLVPEKAVQGDYLCLLDGCPVPVVLRKLGANCNDEDAYQFVGEAHVDDVSLDMVQTWLDRAKATKKVFAIH